MTPDGAATAAPATPCSRARTAAAARRRPLPRPRRRRRRRRRRHRRRCLAAPTAVPRRLDAIPGAAGSDVDRVIDVPEEAPLRGSTPKPPGGDELGGEGEWLMADAEERDCKPSSSGGNSPAALLTPRLGDRNGTRGFRVLGTGSGHQRFRSCLDGNRGSSSTKLASLVVFTVALRLRRLRCF